MDFGMFTGFHVRQGLTQAEAFRSLRARSQAGELGIDSVCLAEHHFTPNSLWCPAKKVVPEFKESLPHRPADG